MSPKLALRVAVLGMVALVAFGILLFRLWALQVLAAPRYQAVAKKQQSRTVRVPAPRGRILDARGRPLVVNAPSLDLQVDPTVLPFATVAERNRVRHVLRRVAPVIQRPVKDMMAAVRRAYAYDPFQAATVATHLDRPSVFYLEENGTRFRGLRVVDNAIRRYPYGALAAHVYGTISQVSRQELNQPSYKRWYQAGDVIGQSGVEGAYDRYLRGKNGLLHVSVDALGNVQPGAYEQPSPMPGYDLRLTIDENVQRAAEEALQWGVKNAPTGRGDTGALIAMDPSTGAIKALASYPTFNPNFVVSDNPAFHHYLVRLERPSTKDPNYRPLLDNAISGLYPPGSTFKPFTAIAAYNEGLIGADTPLQCTADYTVHGQTFKNWNPYINEPMTLPTALTQSCDTFFYRLGFGIWQLGANKGTPLQTWAGHMGFGHYTNIDIGGESKGFLATPAWKRRHFRPACKAGNQAACWDLDWHPGDSINMAIGQGNLLVTPLQMAVAYAAIANGGTIVTPHIGQDIESNGQVQVDLSRRPEHSSGVSPLFLQAIRNGLYGVTHDPNGTAYSVFSSFPIPVAGKTGTAQVASQPADDSLFASYAPAGTGQKPKLVVICVITNGGHGGEAAAPAVLRFYSSYFHARLPNVGTPQDKST